MQEHVVFGAVLWSDADGAAAGSLVTQRVSSLGMNIRIGSRASRLAMAQSQSILGQLKQLYPQHTFTIVPVSTQGDLDQESKLSEAGGQGIFVKALHDALLRREVDVLVHSCKDLPAVGPADIILAAVPPRQVAQDALVFPANIKPVDLSKLKPGARIGTSSPRRRYQVQALRPDLVCMELRGNVDTRLRKLNEGQYDAVVLAEAGLLRLGINPPRLLLEGAGHVPAAAQGALAVECLADAVDIRKILLALDHPDSRAAVTAERELLRLIKAGCHVPLGLYVRVGAGKMLQMEAMLPKRPGFAGFCQVIDDTSPLKLAERMTTALKRDAGRELSKWSSTS